MLTTQSWFGVCGIVVTTADDCKDLLYDFLLELLYLFKVEEIVFSRFDVERIEQARGK